MLRNGKLHSQFGNVEEIGEGGFGKVYKAFERSDNQKKPFAIKVVRMHIKTETKDPVAELYKHKVWKEVDAMIRMKTDNAVQIYSSWFEELN